MTTQAEKGRAFRALHEQSEPFVVANAWDAGSARLFEQAGYAAIATTSAGYAFSLGQLDNMVGRDAILLNASAIVAATQLPVSADLEDGFGSAPEAVAETIKLAADTGLVGGSIEDSTYDKDSPLYDIEKSTDRVRAAVEAARSLSFDFTVTARAENFLVGRPDIADVISRLQAYQDAGADVLYAPGITEPSDIRTIASAIDRPLNVVVGLSKAMPDLATLGELGVRRVSVGSAIARLAYGQSVRAAQDILVKGNFDSLADAMPYGEISERLSR